MEVDKVVNEIDANIKVLTDRATQLKEHLDVKINPTIKQLVSDRKVILKDLAMIDGAIQAYAGSKKIVSPEVSTEVLNA